MSILVAVIIHTGGVQNDPAIYTCIATNTITTGHTGQLDTVNRSTVYYMLQRKAFNGHGKFQNPAHTAINTS